MEILTQIVNFFLGLGASVFVPFIMIIAGLIVRMKVKDAISSGITLAVAFTGMNLIISFMKDSLNPAAQAIMSATGMSFPVVDGGWTTMALYLLLAVAFLMFPLLIGINVLMILLNKNEHDQCGSVECMAEDFHSSCSGIHYKECYSGICGGSSAGCGRIEIGRCQPA